MNDNNLIINLKENKNSIFTLDEFRKNIYYSKNDEEYNSPNLTSGNKLTSCSLNSNNKFSIEEIEKQNIFDVSKVQNSPKKNLENSPLTKNNKISLKKKHLILKMVEKDKSPKKQNHFYEPTEDFKIIKNERKDVYGTEINVKNKKKVKVSFKDEITFQPLVQFINIESYKKYNFLYGTIKDCDNTAKCQCCSIF